MKKVDRRKRPTLADVAERAGTSTAVVSYVLNDGPRPVAAATRERVLDAITELGYRPNRVARALASRRSNTLGLVLPDASNAFFRDLSGAVQAAAFDLGHLTMIGNSALDEQREQAYVDAFVDAHVDGLIVASTGTGAWSDRLVPAGTPLVCLHKRLDAARGVVIQAHDRHGGRIATEHLHDHGHDEVWCLSGPDEPGPLEERVEGWREAGRRAAVKPGRLIRSRIGAAEAAAALEDVLASDEQPRAIFAVTDEQALGVLHAANRAGLSVPDDLAVVAMDGTSAGTVSVPPLTTVAVPIDDMARAAVDVVVSGTEAAPPPLPVHLVARSSCGCPDRPTGSTQS